MIEQTPPKGALHSGLDRSPIPSALLSARDPGEQAALASEAVTALGLPEGESLVQELSTDYRALAEVPEEVVEVSGRKNTGFNFHQSIPIILHPTHSPHSGGNRLLDGSM